jgi:hypothetical protein
MHPYHPDFLPISTIAAAITTATQSWRNSVLIYCLNRNMGIKEGGDVD